MVSGLPLSATLDDLAALYLATIQAIAYGTRDIIEAMNKAGYRDRHDLRLRRWYREIRCSARTCRRHRLCIVLPHGPEAVLLGAAILGAMSAGISPACRRRWRR